MNGEASAMIWRFITMFYFILYILVRNGLAVEFFSDPQGSTAFFASFFIKFALNVILGMLLSHLFWVGLKNKYILSIFMIFLLLMSYMPVLYWTGFTANLSEPWNQALIYVVNASDFIQCTLGYVFVPWRRSFFF